MVERCGGCGITFKKHVPIMKMLVAIGIIVAIYGITTDFYFYFSLSAENKAIGIGRAQLAFSVIGAILFISALLFGVRPEVEWDVLKARAWGETWESDSKLLLGSKGTDNDADAIASFRRSFKQNLLRLRAEDLSISVEASFKITTAALVAADIPQLVVMGEFKKEGNVDSTALALAILGKLIISIFARFHQNVWSCNNH
jgi:hypothetical protein